MKEGHKLRNLQYIDQVKELLHRVDKEYPIELAYLFGSYAKGKQSRTSDIDIALLFKQNYEAREELLIRGRIIDQGERLLRKKIDVVPLAKASPLLKYEIIRSGVVLRDSPQRGTVESLALREYFDFRYYSEIYNQAMLNRIKHKTYFRGETDGTSRNSHE